MTDQLERLMEDVELEQRQVEQLTRQLEQVAFVKGCAAGAAVMTALIIAFFSFFL